MARTIGFIDAPIFDEHDTGSHPENAFRLAAVRAAIADSPVRRRLAPLEFDAASIDDLIQAHDPGLVRVIEQVAAAGGAWIDGDTVVTPQSFAVATRAAGAAIRVVRAVMTGEFPAAAAIVRPPGHHATPDRAMGFCLFNNVAVAAAYARERHGVERSLIIDFDVHHGNGTQDIFYYDPSVFYFSVHQWPLFPGTGRPDQTGGGPGLGTTANVPLPAGCGDDVYRQVFDTVLTPLAKRYHPELIIVSAGYDAYWADPLADERLTVQGYAALMESIVAMADDLCGGKIAWVLEGGYDPRGLAASVVASLGVLTGESDVREPMPAPTAPRPAAAQAAIDAVRRHHALQ